MTRRPNTHNVPMRVAELEDEAEALTLKLSGMSYRQIAEAQGVHVSTAHDRVQRALKAYIPQDEVEALRKIEDARLEATTTQVLKVIAAPDAPVDALLDAAKTLVRIQERRAKLWGLDTPVAQKVEVTHVDQLDHDIERLMEELGAGG
jgi:transposase